MSTRTLKTPKVGRRCCGLQRKDVRREGRRRPNPKDLYGQTAADAGRPQRGSEAAIREGWHRPEPLVGPRQRKSA
jgi:hypothetical protein